MTALLFKGKMAYQMYEVIATWYGDAIGNMSLGEHILNAIGAGSDKSTISNIINNLMDLCAYQLSPIFESVGYALALLFFIISLMELANSERLTIEYFIKFFSKFIIAAVAISYSPQIIEYGFKFGNALANLMINNESNGLDSVTVYQSYLQVFHETEPDWVPLLIGSINILIMNIVGLVLVIVTYVISFTRLFEVAIRGVTMPLALAGLTDDGWKGPAGRYVKKYIAVCAQGVILVLIGRINSLIVGLIASEQINAQTIEASVTGGGLMSFILLLGVGYASVSLMFKSLGFINDVFGV